MSTAFEDVLPVHLDDEGRLHRTDGPAVINGDGSEEWWFKGERHIVVPAGDPVDLLDHGQGWFGPRGDNFGKEEA